MSTGIERTSFSFREVAEQWGVSLWTVRRLVERGELKAVNIGALQRISRAEVERAEQYGVGTPRSRKAKE
ncbi:MAG: excisionase family DNA-binding protein [Terriglobales bacterium]